MMATLLWTDPTTAVRGVPLIASARWIVSLKEFVVGQQQAAAEANKKRVANKDANNS
jgi:hypothetical protein